MTHPEKIIFPELTPDRLFEIDRRVKDSCAKEREIEAVLDNARRLKEVGGEVLLNVLLEAMRRRGHLTVETAWEVGHIAGFYTGGDGGQAKRDLNRLAQRNQAVRHDGYWRHINEPEHMRVKYKYWSDYWTPR